MEDKTGILKALSKFGGIKIGNEDVWYNPTSECKKDILAELDEVKKIMGKKIIVKFSDDNKYSSIELVKREKEIPPKEIKEESKPTNWDAKERRTNRSVAMSYAKDLAMVGVIKFEVLEDTAKTIYKFIQGEEGEDSK